MLFLLLSDFLSKNNLSFLRSSAVNMWYLNEKLVAYYLFISNSFIPRRKQPCSVGDVFAFCWTLYIQAKGKRAVNFHFSCGLRWSAVYFRKSRSVNRLDSLSLNSDKFKDVRILHAFVRVALARNGLKSHMGHFCFTSRPASLAA